MRAMILAAGRGERMGELTLHTPKPLLKVGGHFLIEYAIANLKQADITDIVINIAYHQEQITAALGNGHAFGVDIVYSREKERLETGGGILQALPLLGDEPFIVISSDVISDYPLQQLHCPSDSLAHLLMVDNPHYHPRGDFGIRNGKIVTDAMPTFAFASVGIYRKELFANCHPGHFRLTNVLVPAITAGNVTGEHYQGMWYNIGTPQELADINQ